MDGHPHARDLLEELEVEDQLGTVPAFRPALRQYAHAARRSLSVELEHEHILAPAPHEPPQNDDDNDNEPDQPPAAAEDQPNQSHPPHAHQHFPTLPGWQQAYYSTGDDEDEPTCRVCLTGDDPLADDGVGGVLGPLITPCLCSGSVAWIHAGCLDRWRRSSTSSTAAAACPQCGLRYRFSAPRGGSTAVWALHCQPLRLLVSAILVLVLTCTVGLIAMSGMQFLSHWSTTTRAIQGLTTAPNPGYSIKLGTIQPLVTITHHGSGRPGDSYNWRREPLDSVARSSLEAIRLVFETKREDRVWIEPWAFDETYARPRVQLDAAEQVVSPLSAKGPSPFRRLVRYFGLYFSKDEGGDSDASDFSDEPDEEQIQEYTSYLPLFHVTEEDAPDDILFWGAEPQRARIAKNLDVDRLIEASRAPDPLSADPDVRSGLAQREMLPYLRQVTIRHVYTAAFNTIPNASNQMGDRPKPSRAPSNRNNPNHHQSRWRSLAGWVRTLVHGLLIGIFVGMHIMVLMLSEGARALVDGLARSGAGMLAIFEGSRLRWDGMFLLVRIGVLGLVALLRQHFQAAMPLPRIVPGAHVPVRSHSRIYAGYVLQVVLAAAPAFLGPYWADWWGGYPLAAYGKPGIVQELFFTQTFAGSPGLPIIADSLLAPLATVSPTVARIRAASTSRWTSAPWTVPDDTAAEGVRRLVRGILDPSDPLAQRTPLDVYRGLVQTDELPVGHIKPWEAAASLVSRNPHDSIALSARLGAAVALGAPIVVALGLLFTMVVLCQSHLFIFFNQVNLSIRRVARQTVRLLLVDPLRKFVRWVPERLRAWTACAAGGDAAAIPQPTPPVQPAPPLPEQQHGEGRDPPLQADIHLRLGMWEVGLHFEPDQRRDVDWIADVAHRVDPQPQLQHHHRGNAVDPLAGQAGHGARRARARAARAARAEAAGTDETATPGRSPARLSLILSDLANLYGSLEIILNHVRIAAVLGPFLPWIILYAMLRNAETMLLLDRQVLDLSRR